MKSRNNATQLAAGGSLSKTTLDDSLETEAHALYLYDLKRSNTILSACFLNGGPVFNVNDMIQPSKKSANVGTSLTAYFNNQSVALSLKVKYFF